MPALEPRVEMEFQRTNAALGKPVDVERLLDLCAALTAETAEAKRELAEEQLARLDDDKSHDKACKGLEIAEDALRAECKKLDAIVEQSADADLASVSITKIKGVADGLREIAWRLS